MADTASEFSRYFAEAIKAETEKVRSKYEREIERVRTECNLARVTQLEEVRRETTRVYEDRIRELKATHRQELEALGDAPALRLRIEELEALLDGDSAKKKAKAFDKLKAESLAVIAEGSACVKKMAGSLEALALKMEAICSAVGMESYPDVELAKIHLKLARAWLASLGPKPDVAELRELPGVC